MQWRGLVLWCAASRAPLISNTPPYRQDSLQTHPGTLLSICCQLSRASSSLLPPNGARNASKED